MYNKIFHGKCHSCISQDINPLDHCEGCRFFDANWDKPNLYVPEYKNLLEVVDEYKKRFLADLERNERYGYTPVIEDIGNNTYKIKGSNDNVYLKAESLTAVQKNVGLLGDIKKITRVIEEQINAGYGIPLEFLEKYGADFKKEIECHPLYESLVLPLIIENRLDHLLPESVQDMFVF